MKTILFLGAAVFQLPPIQYALKQGYRVITTDNRPHNLGHQYAHQAYFVSTLDQEAVLAIAKKEQVDGVISYGSDISAPTAAYISEQLKLPTNGLKTVLTLTSKIKFRQFLAQEQLQHQEFRYFNLEHRSNIFSYLQKVPFPVVLKPIDASGSKGVTLLNGSNQPTWAQKIDRAYQHSPAKTVIIEQFIERKGQQICGDGYMEKGQLVLMEFGDGYFYKDKTYLAPYAESFPSKHDVQLLQKAAQQVALVLQKIGFWQGTFNFDIWITSDDQVFINEIGPRSGGNFIPQAIYRRTNMDLVAAAVEGSWDRTYCLPIHQKKQGGFIACYMLHSLQEGILKQIIIDPRIQPNIIAHHPYIPIGTIVAPFSQANRAIGNYILQFESQVDMQTKMAQINDLFQVVLA